MSVHCLRGELPKHATRRQLDVLAAYVEAGGSVSSAAARAGVRPSTAKRHLADLRASYDNVNLPFQAASNGTADTQWHTTPGFTDEPKFKVNLAGDVRTVTSITLYSNVVVGQTICKYGKTTGYGCGEVEEKEADAHWVPNQTGRYISLKRCDTDLSTEGDSGGPDFFNSSAFGMVSGWQFGGLLCKDELVFASISYMQSNLNLTIKLG